MTRGRAAAGLLLAVGMLAGCQAAKPPPAKALLVVTWIVPGRAPQTSQTPFRDMQACEQARAALTRSSPSAPAAGPVDEAAAKTAMEEASARAAKIGATVRVPGAEGALGGGAAPQVSAICIPNGPGRGS